MMELEARHERVKQNVAGSSHKSKVAFIVGITGGLVVILLIYELFVIVPEVLVVHLKRFSYNRYFKNKLETFVDFPINDLDFSVYVACKNRQPSNRYVLYAISCHHGGLGGGHYTAFVRDGHNTWYEFDDSRVSPVSEEMIKTSAAYVIFYKRV